MSAFERWTVGVHVVAAALFIGLHPKGTVAPLTDWRSLTAGVLVTTVSGVLSCTWDHEVGFAGMIGPVNGYLAAGLAHQFL
ncbi:hypothetical protein [Kitasatospora purpeofusca]|uniref:Uncharacterized protein n=1 Tax=Kitasatospora purpeofusca TaxID=67352 RepID=A0ABZ1UDW2_9ACTN|nr:hypothetical protein [Kitasatospora purpeofusca]